MWSGWWDATGVPPENLLSYFAALKRTLGTAAVNDFVTVYLGAGHVPLWRQRTSTRVAGFPTPMIDWVEAA